MAQGQAFPELILAYNPTTEELVLLEGHVRMTGFLLRPENLPSELPVLLGVSPHMKKRLQVSGTYEHAIDLNYPSIFDVTSSILTGRPSLALRSRAKQISWVFAASARYRKEGLSFRT